MPNCGGCSGHTEYRSVPQRSTSTTSTNIYEVEALYFQRLERKYLGLLVDRPEPAQAQRAGTNHGVVILAVRRGSPAYAANLLPGDIVVKINDQDAELENWASLETWGGAIREVTIMRNGQTRTVPLAINADGSWPS
jgi:S1-C subfamily serine protease